LPCVPVGAGVGAASSGERFLRTRAR
jgi:hypothetical protein